MTDIDFAQYIPNLGMGEIPFAKLTLILIGAIIAFVFFTYKHRVHIIVEDGMGSMRKRKTDWVRSFRRKKDGIKYLDFLFSRKRITDQYMPIAGGFSHTYILYEDKSGAFHEFKLRRDSMTDVYTVKAIPANVLSAQTAMLTQLNQDYKKETWWAKWGQYVLPVVLVVAILFMWIYGFEKFTELQSASAALLQRAMELHQQTATAT